MRAALLKGSSTAMAVVLAIGMMVSPAAHAQAPSQTGSVQLSASGSYGQGAYTVKYSMPTSVRTGSNLTVTVTLVVDDLGGMYEYILGYYVAVYVYVDSGHVLNGRVGDSTVGDALYPGGHWGPYNVTIPVSTEDTGLSPGSSVNASVAISLQTGVWIAYPFDYNVAQQPLQASAGSIIVDNGGSASTGALSYLPYVAIVVGVGIFAVLLAAPVARKIRKGPKERRDSGEA